MPLPDSPWQLITLLFLPLSAIACHRDGDLVSEAGGGVFDFT